MKYNLVLVPHTIRIKCTLAFILYNIYINSYLYIMFIGFFLLEKNFEVKSIKVVDSRVCTQEAELCFSCGWKKQSVSGQFFRF